MSERRGAFLKILQHATLVQLSFLSSESAWTPPTNPSAGAKLGILPACTSPQGGLDGECVPSPKGEFWAPMAPHGIELAGDRLEGES